MKTSNVREKIMSDMSDDIGGLSGRWTLFTGLKNPLKETTVATTLFSIDSAEETKIGVGRLFESKKKIGEREAIVSKFSLDSIEAAVGDTVSMHYDVQLLMNLF